MNIPVNKTFSGFPGLVFLLLVLTVSACVAVTIGKLDMSPAEVWHTLVLRISPFGNQEALPDLYETVVWELRVPRIILTIAVGAALASAGAIFQGCFRNPLVEPYILGVSSGAAFGAALGIFFPVMFSVQAFSFLFGVIAVACTYGFGRIRGETPMLTLILAGVITGSVFGGRIHNGRHCLGGPDDAACHANDRWC